MECQLVKYLNRTLKAGTIAIDIPSGLFCDSNHANISECIVHADYTLSFQFPKFSFFLSDHQSIVGHWEVLDIGLHARAIEETPTLYRFIAQPDMAPMLKKRSKFSHKGSYGHALIVAGSYGMMGLLFCLLALPCRQGQGLLQRIFPVRL